MFLIKYFSEMNQLIVRFPFGHVNSGLAKHRALLVLLHAFSFAFFFSFSFSFFLVPAVCTGNYQRTKYVARKTLISNDVAADSANRGS